ncbi:hypothetical protein COU60_00115 [Candidatus Pacearchaeota archaeon CG10_big_fil_rev_8_21_14_0_10_34_76]|nr:MAG: hypothetical protein COU60_00115 [Candidatus Pacearchaeota archaeon CG10_big_fil_rev_8_21_14_0_10_34_76]
MAMIGVDLDDTVKDTLRCVNEFYEIETGIKIPLSKYTTYLWEDVWGCTREEAIARWHRFVDSENYDRTPPIEGARDSLCSLSLKNNLAIITSRPEINKQRTEEWVRRNIPGIEFEFFYTRGFEGGKRAKGDICIENGINLIFEDDISNSLECAMKGIDVIMFDKPYNLGLEHGKIQRVSSWAEALKIYECLNGHRENA